MRAAENIFGIDARSELCRSCIHTNVCVKDKNLFDDHFIPGHPMFTDNSALYEKFKEREKAGFPCKDYLHDIVRCKDCSRQCICYHSADYYCADGEKINGT